MRIHNQDVEESDGSIVSILLSVTPAELVHIEAGLKLLAKQRYHKLGNGITRELITYIKQYLNEAHINRGYLKNLKV